MPAGGDGGSRVGSGAGQQSAGSATSSGISINFEKLSGISNYGNWKFSMRMYLIHEDLWDCIEESSTGVPQVNDARKQQKALAKICLMVLPGSFSHVRNATTGHQAWNNLKTAYEDKGLCRRLGLLRTLFGSKLEQFNDMESYLLKITDLDQQLRDINAPLDDDFLSVLMLSGLPPDYDPLIMALENSNVKLCSETVKSKLLQEFLRRDFDRVEESSLFTKQPQKGGYKYSAKSRCYICKKTGHFAKYCDTKINKNDDKRSEKAWNGTLLTALAVNINCNAWYVDSGATCHMTNNKNIMKNYVVDTPRLVTAANNQNMCTEGHGDVELILKGQQHKTTICDVIFVPGLSTNLLSVSKLTAKGLEVHFNDEECNICYGETIVASARKTNGVYKLNTVNDSSDGSALATTDSRSSVSPISETEEETDSNLQEEACQSTVETLSLLEAQSTAEGQQAEVAYMSEASPSQQLWHRRLGHLNKRSMDLLRKGMANGINYTDSDYSPCVACIEGKQARLPFPKKSYSRASEKLGLIHSDLCGPMSVSSFSGAKYLLTFIDDYTRMTFGYFIKTKDQVLPVFKEFKNLMENQTDLKIKKLRSDNGCEYINKQFQAFLKEHGIEHQTTVPYSPQQNGVAERANRTIMEAARCMLQDSGLEKRYWAEAVNTAIFIKNKAPSKAVRDSTPEEKWTGNKVDLSNLRVFGCTAYALVPSERRKKLDAKSKKYIFVGYCNESKGFRLVDPENPSKCIKSRDVQFIEGKSVQNIDSNLNQDNTNDLEFLNNMEQVESENPSEEYPNLDVSDTSSSSSYDHEPTDVSWNPNMTSDDASSEEIEDPVEMVMTASAHIDVPLSLQEALSGHEKEHWEKAMAEEYESFENNKAWNLTELPPGKKAVKCKWVFKKKYDADGKLVRYKARLVAKGFTQTYGIDYKETYSPVVRYSTIRTLLALAVNLDMDVDHMDVKTAFLNGDLKETVFMEQPEGYGVKGKENYVFKLNKAIYGLKQASKAWYDMIDKALTDLQFKKSLTEPCVYVKSEETGNIIILAIYVDDILIFSRNGPEKNKLKEELMRKFEMKDLGKATHILGMRLRQEQNKIILDQKNYIHRVLEQFKMTECNPVSTPLENGIKLEKGDKCDPHSRYRSLIGCIMYIAVCTRPDIAHAASLLSQFNNSHSDTHWKAAKRVLRYLKGTMDYNIVFEKSTVGVAGYIDADWASNQVDRRSYTGYVFKIGNSAVSWESRKQRTVALSSTEAEYMALSEGAKEALFIRNFIYECLGKWLTITLYNDSQSAQKLCKSQINHSRSKHIDIRHHFVREVTNSEIVKLEYMPTECMPADVLTKPLSKDKHCNCISNLGLTTV